jgi:hypothetical protein
MAIIPAAEKVFMVSNSTNTTYSGSAALKAMQQWYTMQDVIDTVGGGGSTPTLQQVTDEGNTSTNKIVVTNEVDSSVEINNSGSIILTSGNISSTLNNTGVVANGVELSFPDKPAGSYTIATTSDAPVSSYQVFTALLTQSGGSNPLSLSSGAVQEGVSYRVRDANETADFSNVGGPGVGQAFDFTWFIATATATPNSYGNGQLEYNAGAPVATVLENTIGNIWFTYGGDGLYFVNSDGLFPITGTAPFIGSAGSVEADIAVIDIRGNSGSSMEITSTNSLGSSYDNQLVNTSLEIRVYN